jgi:hypothetical protein
MRVTLSKLPVFRRELHATRKDQCARRT